MSVPDPTSILDEITVTHHANQIVALMAARELHRRHVARHLTAMNVIDGFISGHEAALLAHAAATEMARHNAHPCPDGCEHCDPASELYVDASAIAALSDRDPS